MVTGRTELFNILPYCICPYPVTLPGEVQSIKAIFSGKEIIITGQRGEEINTSVSEFSGQGLQTVVELNDQFSLTFKPLVSSGGRVKRHDTLDIHFCAGDFIFYPSQYLSVVGHDLINSHIA
jgi:hypothetical protein